MAAKKKQNKDEGLLGLFVILIGLGFLVSTFGLGGDGSTPSTTKAQTTAPAISRPTYASGHAPTITGPRKKTANCHSASHRPDYDCTPGALDVRVGQTNIGQTICSPSYVSRNNRVPGEVKKAVYAEYGIKAHRNGQYEIDHLVPIKLGGSNDIANLWPQPYARPLGAVQKDRVDNTLNRAVCNNAISLSQAQSTIATDWLSYYKSYIVVKPTAATKTKLPPKKPGTSALGKRTKVSNCTVHQSHGESVLPDPACSPGQASPAVTQQNIQKTVCVTGYTKTVRNVPEAEKNAVYAEYGLTKHAPYSYEVDHIVSLELGGSNDISNLFPEAYAGKYGARIKDTIENDLHRKVCNGKITLQKAQSIIATDWLTYYLGNN